jgi:hypothetical protein
MYPPNVHRGQISEIWPDFRNLTEGYICDPPNIKYTPLIENAFLKEIEIYSNIPLQRECP